MDSGPNPKATCSSLLSLLPLLALSRLRSLEGGKQRAMSAASRLFAGVRTAAPDSNPFTSIAYTLYQSLYSPMSDFYMRSIPALHALYGTCVAISPFSSTEPSRADQRPLVLPPLVRSGEQTMRRYDRQAIIIIAALVVRWRRHKTDVWFLRVTRTARGGYITPHFAIAWQISSLLFLVVLQVSSLLPFPPRRRAELTHRRRQPYLVMVYDHAVGNDWPGYLGGRSMGFLPAWVSTWLAVCFFPASASSSALPFRRADLPRRSFIEQLWSLAVAVCLPRANNKQTNRLASFFSSPTFLNVHFLAGLILCCTSIIIPSVIFSGYYDAGINHYRQARDMLVGYESGWSGMSAEQVETALDGVIPVVDGMLSNLSTFPYTFGIAWSLWFAWISYSYGVSSLFPFLGDLGAG